MLAVVVDDHDMDVTHVIRGDDHLTNAARQTQIYDALGWAVPQMAHIPLIHGADGAKLSKRHGALGVDAYRSLGYLPAALRNYLVRLGWSHGDQEIFSTDEMVEAFDLSAIGRSPARFDLAKLESLNGHYMRLSSDEDLVEALEVILPEIGPERGLGRTFPPALRLKLLAAMPGLRERAKTLVELLDSAYYLYAERPLKLDERAKGLLSEGGARLAGIGPKLEAVGDWTAPALEGVVRSHAETVGAKLGQVAQPLRAALTGRATSPGLFDVMAVLGRDEALARLNDQVPG
jgi:glutamyl-tRNA synthetase